MQGECTAFTERLYDGLWNIYRKTAGEFNLGSKTILVGG